ncbi:MAG: DUF2760 domain-containing protein [Kiritimatiellaeota bacterium]|nr:DUF2760 domain-containing protein [Kiritimatiellota bacterium]
MRRFLFALRAFWRVLRAPDPGAAFARFELPAESARPAAEQEKGARRDLAEDAVYTLVLLQRGGRLVDFLFEDIAAFDDAQVGAAVRQIHAGCRRVLEDHFGILTVLEGGEGSIVTIPEGFDPSTVQLSGRISGSPPFSGVLRHRGWRVAKTDFPQRSARLDPSVIQPAEVEVR